MVKLIRETVREMLLQGPEIRSLQVGGYPITAELAVSPEQHQVGLMHRRSLDPDCGMLFCYDEPQELSFWMRDTHVPLSIAFIDDEGRVASIEDMDPYSESPVRSSVPCRWALEANQGWFSDRNIRIGAKILGLDV
jgi:uncharacterized membrane protein (UPF0127 family)